MVISKSDYLLYLKHPAWLWLKKHAKNKLPPVDENTQAVFDSGHEFETYAQQLFTPSVSLGFNGFSQYESLLHRTQEAMESDKKFVFQARFQPDELTCICDVVEKIDSRTVNIYEIKSSTKAKPEHEYELAFQKHVLSLCGYTVNSCFVVHVSPDYVRQGEINIRLLTKTTDITSPVQSLSVQTQTHINSARQTLAGNIPSLSPALCGLDSLSQWLEIYKSLVKLPKYSIYDLCLLKPELVARLEKLQINLIADIPPDLPLSEKQQLQISVTKKGTTLYDKQWIQKHLRSYVFPLYFFDYETMSSTVPFFSGLKPYQQLPVQYSLHVLEKPGGQLNHFEFLHTSNASPVSAIIASLKSHLGSTGSIITWNESFEKTCNKLLATLDPESATFLESVNDRIVDLMLPFSKGHYAHPDFLGSASIKKVLPVLVPNLSYKDLDIGDGASAQRQWMETFLYQKTTQNSNTIAQNLLDYCRLDTLAMVEIYNHLTSLKDHSSGSIPKTNRPLASNIPAQPSLFE